MRILLVSQMYPGPADPDLGVFVRQMELALRERGHEHVDLSGHSGEADRLNEEHAERTADDGAEESRGRPDDDRGVAAHLVDGALPLRGRARLAVRDRRERSGRTRRRRTARPR